MATSTDDSVYDAITELSQTLITCFDRAGDLPTTGSDYNMGQRVAYGDCVRLVRQHASTYLLAGRPEKQTASLLQHMRNGLITPDGDSPSHVTSSATNA